MVVMVVVLLVVMLLVVVVLVAAVLTGRPSVSRNTLGSRPWAVRGLVLAQLVLFNLILHAGAVIHHWERGEEGSSKQSRAGSSASLSSTRIPRVWHSLTWNVDYPARVVCGTHVHRMSFG